MVSRDGTVRWMADRAKARHTPDGAIIADSITHRRRPSTAVSRTSWPQRVSRSSGRLPRASSGWTDCSPRPTPASRCSRWRTGQASKSGSPTRRCRSACSASRCRPASTSAPPSSARSSTTSASGWSAPSQRLTAFVVDSRLRGLDGVVRSFAVEGAVDRRLPGARPWHPCSWWCARSRATRGIAALLDAVDEPVYELELGADGIWRTTAGTGIARILGVKGADERVLAAAVLDDDRAVCRGTPRASRGRAGLEREFRVRTSTARVRWLWSERRGGAKATG